jgi:hypothetical protein
MDIMIDRILDRRLWNNEYSLITKYNHVMNQDVDSDDNGAITWENGTEEEIKNMLKQHYLGNINIEDYWNIGDTRKVQLSAIDDKLTNESQPEQTVELVIIGFNHDVLVNSIDTRDKAAITVQVKNCLCNLGYMNNSWCAPDDARWFSSRRRIWCNVNFKHALPEYLQNLIHGVIKLTNTYTPFINIYTGECNSRQNVSMDDCFLLSEWEIWGKQNLDSSTWSSLDADGTQYEYMKTQSNRIKISYNSTSSYKNTWWGRTSNISENYNLPALFIQCGSSGLYASYNTSFYTVFGIAPAFCH